MIPNGLGQYNISVYGTANPIVSVQFFLMEGNTVVATLSGKTGTFENIAPGCYRIIICVDADIDRYCCKDLPCAPDPEGCCELTYHFFTDFPNPVWDFGDQSGSTDPNPVHEYTNLNTYPGEGVTQTTVQVSSGAKIVQSSIFFPPGIWIGADCTDAGNSDVLMNTLNPALNVLPGLSHSGKSISIKGSITMNVDYQFSACDFCMHPDSRIVSTANTLSFLSGALLHEAPCEENAWYGVDIRRGAIVGDSAEFTGAYNAMRVPPGLTDVPRYLFTDCRFNRNFLGIHVASPVVFSVFAGNTLGLNSGLVPWPGADKAPCGWVQTIDKPADIYPFAGIYAETAPGGPVISVNLPAVAITPNVFINLANGIYLQDANGLIRRCRFINMLSGTYFAEENGTPVPDDGFGIALFTNNTRSLRQWGLGKTAAQALTFDNCQHAVYISMQPQFAGGDVLLLSYNNRMQVAHAYTLLGNYSTFRANSVIQNNDIDYTGNYGIYVENASETTRLGITRNRLETTAANATGVLLYNFSPIPLGGDYRVSVTNNLDDATHNDGIFGGADGVALGYFGHALVENNTVGGFNRFGIYNLDSPEDYIRCNQAASTGLAAIRNDRSQYTRMEYNATDNTGRGIQIDGPCNNSLISCNTIGSHDIGLFYDAAAVTGRQLPNETSAGNLWTGAYTDMAARIDLAGLIDQSFYYYRTGEIDPNKIFPPNEIWFHLKTAGITCGTGCPVAGITEREPTELDDHIASGTLDPGGLSGYLLKRNLYKDLLYYPGLLQSNAALQNFYNSYGTSTGGKLVQIEKTLADGFSLSTQQQTQWSASQAGLLAAFDQLDQLDSLVQAGADLETQQTQRAALMQQATSAQATLQTLYSDNLGARQQSVSAIQQMLNNVSPTAQWETNEKTLNEIYLLTSFVDQAPDSLQQVQIQQIAEQCIADGGPAVTRARAWYFALSGTRIEVNCGGTIERGANGKEKSQFAMKVSPNPARHSILVQFSEITDAGSRLDIFDLSGNLKKSLAVPNSVQDISVPTANFPSGYYICRLVQGEWIVATSRFTVLR